MDECSCFPTGFPFLKAKLSYNYGRSVRPSVCPYETDFGMLETLIIKLY